MRFLADSGPDPGGKLTFSFYFVLKHSWVMFLGARESGRSIELGSWVGLTSRECPEHGHDTAVRKGTGVGHLLKTVLKTY